MSISTDPLDRRLAVAPMMDWTDRHCRFLHRLIAPKTLLYTEMVTTGAVLRGDPLRHLEHDPAEHPLALQLGGSEPDDLARAARLAVTSFRFDEINLNCGCPSERVQKGAFGACLMREPLLVARCVAAIRAAVAQPVTVKCRIGVDDSEDWPFFLAFIETVAEAGCRVFIVHARKAWLKGLSPKENREIPPLRYDLVERLKRERPDLTIVLNGGLRDPEAAAAVMAWADGVMIGREAYSNPWSLRAFEATILGSTGARTRDAVLAAYLEYVERQRRPGVPLPTLIKPLLGLFNGVPGARRFRQILSEDARRPDAGPELILTAARAIGTAPGRLRGP